MLRHRLALEKGNIYFNQNAVLTIYGSLNKQPTIHYFDDPLPAHPEGLMRYYEGWKQDGTFKTLYKMVTTTSRVSISTFVLRIVCTLR